jgi:hypothetical protein
MRSISATVDIAATPERVWAVLADLAAYPEWNPFIRSASGKLADGARLTLRLVPPGGRAMTFRPTVLAARPGELLRWIGRLGGIHVIGAAQVSALPQSSAWEGRIPA